MRQELTYKKMVLGIPAGKNNQMSSSTIAGATASGCEGAVTSATTGSVDDPDAAGNAKVLAAGRSLGLQDPTLGAAKSSDFCLQTFAKKRSSNAARN